MLTGGRAFAGETVTDVIASIVTRDPDWCALPPETPAIVQRLLRRCLDRDRRRRLSDASEVRFQIAEALSAPPGTPEYPKVTAGRANRSGLQTALPWTVAGLAGALAGALLWQAWSRPDPGIERLSIETAPGTTLSVGLRPAIALSPDGGRIAFVAASDGTTRLYVRSRDKFEPVLLAGTEGASEPVFSPDGDWIAFFAGTALNKVPATGGPIVPLGTVNDPRGLSWDTPDTLTYTPITTSGVFRIPASGGTPTPVTQLSDKIERTHRWPQALPGGAVIFTVGAAGSPDDYSNATIDAFVPTSGRRQRILTDASMARYVATGHLVFARNRVLYAVKFDPQTLGVSGSPTPVLQGVEDDSTTGAVQFSVAQSGALAYVAGSGEAGARRLVWASRDGQRTSIDLPRGGYLDPKISPDGTRMALRVASGSTSDIWVYDFGRKTFTRLTFGGTNATPAWSPNGRLIYYVALTQAGTATTTVWRRPADGSGVPEEVGRLAYRAYLGQIRADGQAALIVHYATPGRGDIAMLPLDRKGQPIPMVVTQDNEYAAVLSPDSRFVGYASGASGQAEVYVADAAKPDVRWQISTAGGEEPRWSSDGRVLYYRAGSTFMAVPVDTREGFQPGTPQALFDGVYNFRVEAGLSYDVDPKAPRFLLMTQTENDRSLTSIRLVLNWYEELRRIVGGT